MAAELDALLAGTMYAVVYFYTDYDGTHGRMPPRLASPAAAPGVPGVLAFVRANCDDMPEVAARNSGGGDRDGWASKCGRAAFLFFTDGAQVAVDCRRSVRGEDQKGPQGRGREAGWLG
ncbi:hypothetical protein DL771_011655 [Monosporascus sp. 5C6A]|nr:hypothetical protein DL771_011655 [Monosporascus sp. 5C6A]